MSINIKKKHLTIVLGIVIGVVVIVAGIFLTRFILTNIEIKDTENKLRKISAEELQNKIIKELEETNININNTNGNFEIETVFTDTYNETDNFVTAMIIRTYKGEYISGVALPCYKVEKDEQGYFKSITFLTGRDGVEGIVEEKVKKVLKEDYDIELTNGDMRYWERFTELYDDNGEIKKCNIDTSSEDFWKEIYEDITNEEYYNNTTLNMMTFGLEF